MHAYNGVLTSLVYTDTSYIYIAPICGATETLDDSHSGGIKRKRFQMFF